MTDAVLKKAKEGQRRTRKQLAEQSKAKAKTNQSHLKVSDPVTFNQWAEEKFVELVLEMLDESPNGRLSYATVRKEAAYEIGVSQETAKRYIEKYTARRAPFRNFDGQIFLNPRFEPKREEDEGPRTEDETEAAGSETLGEQEVANE